MCCPSPGGASSHCARRVRQLDRYAEHLIAPAEMCSTVSIICARLQMRIRQHFGDVAHRTAGNSRALSDRPPSRPRPGSQLLDEQTHAGCRDAARAPGWSRTARPRRSAAAPITSQHRRHCSSLPTASTKSPSDAGNVSYGTMVGMPVAHPPGRCAGREVDARLVGQERGGRIEHADVDALPAPGSARARAAPSRSPARRTCR